MAILIVDDEGKTREALRSLLNALGYSVILEAKNGEDALRTIQIEKSRIKMIIADLEMPYMNGLELAEKAAAIASIHLAPFLLITSDLSQSEISTARKKQERLDGCLVKPFRKKSLEDAMVAAYRFRCKSRARIVYVGKLAPPELIKYIEQDKTTLELDSSVVTVFQAEDLKNAISLHHDTLATVLVDPLQIDPHQQLEIVEILAEFKKTPLGTSTPIVCLSREAAQIFHLRTICQLFIPFPTTEKSWKDILTIIHNRISTKWEMDQLFHEVRTLVQNRKINLAWKIARKMLNLDENSCEVLCTCGELLASMNKVSQAISSYEKAIDLNPALPRPYIKLLELISTKDSERITALAELTARYCPRNTDALFASAQACWDCGNHKKSKELLEILLQINPQHPDALFLLDLNLRGKAN